MKPDENDETLRIYSIVRTDLTLTSSQITVQVAHAVKTVLYLATIHDLELAKTYMGDHYGTNVILATSSLRRLLRAYTKAQKAGLFSYLIAEDLYPEPGVKTITAIGIGPATRTQMAKITKKFNLL